MENLLDTAKRFHFVGIGGSGMCPLAEILLKKGYEITGSDQSESDTLDRVKSYGIPVHMGHRAENVGDADCVVYSAACRQDNPELIEARRRGIPTLVRKELLGMVSGKFSCPIGVSGAHGKTTTTAMITQILTQAGRDPTALIGGKLPSLGANSRVGESELFVIEADEYTDTFLKLFPKISVILNIDEDHLDYFGSLANILKSFNQFARQTSKYIVVNGDNALALKSLLGVSGKEFLTFGWGRENCCHPENVEETSGVRAEFDLILSGERLGRVRLCVPGMHNVLNALAAASVCGILGLSGEEIIAGLKSFTGVHRRFEFLGEFGGVTVADDFAHHPAELRATLTSAMKMGYNEVWAVFQPHTYSRTYYLLDEFAEVLKIPQHLVMTEILAVREENIYGIKTEDLARKVPGSRWFESFPEIADYVMANAKPGDLILTLGGGDIYKCANLIVERYRDLEAGAKS